MILYAFLCCLLSLSQSLVLKALRAGLRFNKDFTAAFVKEIQLASEHHTLDLWILFILHSMTAHKKTAELLFKKKIASRYTYLLNVVHLSSFPSSLRRYVYFFSHQLSHFSEEHSPKTISVLRLLDMLKRCEFASPFLLSPLSFFIELVLHLTCR